jgi:hypothetical protein
MLLYHHCDAPSVHRRDGYYVGESINKCKKAINM